MLEDTQVESVFPLIGYARALGLFGRSGKFDVQAPYSCLQGSTEYGGQAYERDICGWGAPSAKLSLNLFGAPAISLEELPTYQQDLIVGVGLRVLMRRATRADAQRPTACAATHLQRNSRFGATLAWPLDRRNSLKFALSSGLTARSGGDYDAIAVLWQHRWGAGL